MCRPSNIDGRCETRLLYLLKILILYIAVCELRRGFALQCFHYNYYYPAHAQRMRRSVTDIYIYIYIYIPIARAYCAIMSLALRRSAIITLTRYTHQRRCLAQTIATKGSCMPNLRGIHHGDPLQVQVIITRKRYTLDSLIRPRAVTRCNLAVSGVYMRDFGKMH